MERRGMIYRAWMKHKLEEGKRRETETEKGGINEMPVL